MNWKINFWTILFAIAAGAFLYTHFSQSNTSSQVVVENCETSTADYTISRADAIQRIDGYTDYLADTAIIDPQAAKADGYVNPDVIYFHLPRCELNQMLDSIPDGDVYATLTVKDGANDKDTLDLIFADYPPDTRHTDGKYFDFTSPCPPLCDSIGGRRQ